MGPAARGAGADGSALTSSVSRGTTDAREGHTGGVDVRRKRGAHSSGELVFTDDFMQGVRERRSRGTRAALDWKYSFRLYVFVPLTLMIGIVGGLDLLGNGHWWLGLAGLLVLLSSAVIIGLSARWLLRPVDPMSKERLRQYHEEMRLQNLWREARASYAEWRTGRRAP